MMKAAELALIAENSPPSTRSFFLGLVLVAGMAAAAVAPLVGGVLVSEGDYTATFMLGMGAWCLHLAYTLGVLREPPHPRLRLRTHQGTAREDQEPYQDINSDQHQSQANVPAFRPQHESTLLHRLWTLPILVITPLLKLTANPTLLILAILDFLMFFGVAAFVILIPWSDERFGLPPAEVRFSLSLCCLWYPC